MANLVAPQPLLNLADPPEDGISSVEFSPTSPDVLLAASWDATVRRYDLNRDRPLVAAATQPTACLAATFAGDDATAVVGCVDGSVRVARVDGALQGGQAAALGAHDAGVRCLKYDAQHNVVFSGSWDRTVGGWDPRASNGRVATAEVPGKVFALDLAFGAADTKLVVGTSDRHVVLFDARNLSTPLQHRESSLKHQTRCLKCFPDATGYALSSIEGRVAVEYFAEGDQARKYAFKCHRTKASEDGEEVLRPFGVNAVAFHPFTGAFATGGGDGYVCVWDGLKKKRLWQSARYPAGVACLAFSEDGGRIAVAVSRERRNEKAFSDDVEATPRTAFSDAVFVRRIEDAEVTPKRKVTDAVQVV